VTQGGYVTSKQALGAGYDHRHLAYHTRVGNLVRVGWGIYRVPGLTHSEHDDLIRWTLWSRDRRGTPAAVVSHESALAVHELGDVLPGVIHLSVPVGFRKPEPRGCKLHYGRLPESDVERHEGFEVTTAERTLLDLAARPGFPVRELRRAVSESTERGAVRSAALSARARDLGLQDRLGLSRGGSRRKKPSWSTIPARERFAGRWRTGSVSVRLLLICLCSGSGRASAWSACWPDSSPMTRRHGC
jgi:hypothetical protein